MFLKSFVKSGTLTIIDPDGGTSSHGCGEPEVTLRIHDPGWPNRSLLRPALGVGEGYMDGAYTIEEGDIQSFLDLCFQNTKWGSGHWFLGLVSAFERRGKRLYELNPVSRARKNAAHHYDLSDEFFDMFLDSRRQYSCAYFMSPDDDIETAQEQKLRHIAAKLLLEPGMTVLDIGCGWGGLAMYLAERTGVKVTGITLSQEQLKVAQDRARRAGLADRVEFRLQDYREVPEQFDRIISVGMFEHVGTNHYRTFFRKVRECLKPDGVAVLHSIGRADGPGVTNAWMRKYIFPGGYSPALSEVMPVIEREQLFATDIEILRLHYADTLKRWLERFAERRDEVREIYDERFCRMWEFYLAASQAVFRHGGHVVFQVQMSRQVNAVPMTRDYIQDWERSPKSDGKLDKIA